MAIVILEKNIFMIRYFPKSELEPQQEINAILDRLYPILEYIYMENDLIRGTNMEANIVDNILHLQINYDFFIVRPIQRGPLMQKLIQKQKDEINVYLKTQILQSKKISSV